MKVIELFEMAAAKVHHASNTYYHGTMSEDVAEKIYANGLDPAATEVKYGKSKGALRPQDEHVYITSDLKYAMIYGLGGDMFGHDPYQPDIEKYGEFGFVFEIEGKELIDIGPDEDSVGELIWSFINKRTDGWSKEKYATVSAVSNLAYQKCTEGQMKKLKGGEYSAYAQVGKKLNKIMTDKMKLDLIDCGTHIAHKGKLKVSKCWRFSRHDTKKIKRDGSNFFDYATEWKP